MKPAERSEFAAFLIGLRRDRGFTLRELGEKAGIDFTYLSKIENDGVEPPSINAIGRLSIALGIGTAEHQKFARLADARREHPVHLIGTKPDVNEFVLKRIRQTPLTKQQAAQIIRVLDEPQGQTKKTRQPA